MIRHVLVFKHEAEVMVDECNRWMDSVRQLAHEVPTVRNLTISGECSICHAPTMSRSSSISSHARVCSHMSVILPMSR